MTTTFIVVVVVVIVRWGDKSGHGKKAGKGGGTHKLEGTQTSCDTERTLVDKRYSQTGEVVVVVIVTELRAHAEELAEQERHHCMERRVLSRAPHLRRRKE
jgi:hypothetical protein